MLQTGYSVSGCSVFVATFLLPGHVFTPVLASVEAKISVCSADLLL